MIKHFKQTAIEYARAVVSGEIIAGKEVIAACERFQKDLQRDDLELREHDPDLAINIMQTTLVHAQGEDLDGLPLQGSPFLLQPWQIFIVYNLLGFYYKGTNERRFKEAFIEVARKNGKALSLDTEIPTPSGWRKMEDIHTGDVVFSVDGTPSRVVAESEIFNKPMYRVMFEDGAEVKASADHIWTVQTKGSRRTANARIISHQTYKGVRHDLRESGGWFDITTEQLAGNEFRERRDGKGKEYRYRVPMPEAVEYSEKSLPIDPYTLGVWLGDGTSVDTAITCSREDTAEMIRLLEENGHRCRLYEHSSRTNTIGIDKTSKGKRNVLRDALREIGVFGNKHIPELYMNASVEQRYELLRGMMDTDGYCSKAGQCEFAQKDERMVKQFIELLASLGIKSKARKKIIICNGKECYAYSVLFFCSKDNPCFKLSRKKERLKDHLTERMKAKSIVSVERIEDEPSKCIAIDHSSHLYLCGRNYTATHNTSFIAGLAWAVGIIQRRSGSVCYVVAAALKQTLQAFHFLTYSLEYNKIIDQFEVHDNSFDHSIKYQFRKADGTPDGSMEIIAMPTNPDSQDSFNCNFAIADEVAAYKKPAQYNRFKEAQSAYTNKLMVGITTAGDNVNSFGYGRQEYAAKVATGVVDDDSLFAFVARADQDDKGNVDYTNPIQHQKANPSYGVTKRPQDLINAALQAQNDPQQRKDFLSRELDIYSAAMRAWFDLDEFRASDRQYTWTLEELSKLPIDWYGGADLSRMYDLTAAALYGQYGEVNIIITHAFFPVTQAARKADEDNIPLFGWADDGWLTMCNSPTVNVSDVVNWFKEMRTRGFKIKMVGHDRKFAGEEYFPAMKAAHFSVRDIPQYYYLKSQGFRHIEKAAKDGHLYYVHSEAYEYCVSNVRAIEKTDDAIQYEKIQPEHRIDLFDASVFACVAMMNQTEKSKKAAAWWSE